MPARPFPGRRWWWPPPRSGRMSTRAGTAASSIRRTSSRTADSATSSASTTGWGGIAELSRGSRPRPAPTRRRASACSARPTPPIRHRGAPGTGGGSRSATATPIGWTPHPAPCAVIAPFPAPVGSVVKVGTSGPLARGLPGEGRRRQLSRLGLLCRDLSRPAALGRPRGLLLPGPTLYGRRLQGRRLADQLSRDPRSRRAGPQLRPQRREGRTLVRRARNRGVHGHRPAQPRAPAGDDPVEDVRVSVSAPSPRRPGRGRCAARVRAH